MGLLKGIIQDSEIHFRKISEHVSPKDKIF